MKMTLAECKARLDRAKAGAEFIARLLQQDNGELTLYYYDKKEIDYDKQYKAIGDMPGTLSIILKTELEAYGKEITMLEHAVVKLEEQVRTLAVDVEIQ